MQPCNRSDKGAGVADRSREGVLGLAAGQHPGLPSPRTPRASGMAARPEGMPIMSATELLADLGRAPDKQAAEPVDPRTAQDLRAEITRLKNEVQRLNALVVQKDELLLHADLRIRKLQEYAPKLRGGRQPARQGLVDAGAEGAPPPQPPPPLQASGLLRQPGAVAPAPAVGFGTGGAAKPASAGAKRKQPEGGATRPGWCHHNRQRSRCIECGGTGVCEHNRVRRNCRDCGGNNLCIPHKKPKSRCIDCGGASTCEHKKLRRHCFECGGVAVCAHKRIRRDCKICKGRCGSGAARSSLSPTHSLARSCPTNCPFVHAAAVLPCLRGGGAAVEADLRSCLPACLPWPTPHACSTNCSPPPLSATPLLVAVPSAYTTNTEARAKSASASTTCRAGSAKSAPQAQGPKQQAPPRPLLPPRQQQQLWSKRPCPWLAGDLQGSSACGQCRRYSPPPCNPPCRHPRQRVCDGSEDVNAGRADDRAAATGGRRWSADPKPQTKS